MKLPTISRRILIGAGAAGVAAIAALGLSFSPRTLLRQIMETRLPGVSVDPEGYALFESDAFADDKGMFAYLKFSASAAAGRMFGLSGISQMPVIGPGVIGFERRVLTLFLTGSNFFELADPRSEPVIYFGPPPAACPNPFRRQTLPGRTPMPD